MGEDFVAFFVALARDRITRARAALTGVPSRDALTRELHTLKGEAQLVGLTTIAEIARRLEDAHRADRPGAKELLLEGLAIIEAMLEAPARSDLVADRLNAFERNLSAYLAPPK